MEWKTYRDRFYDWSESTQIARISSLTSFGAPSEICDIAEDIGDEKAASRLVKKASAAGVRFGPDELLRLMYFCDREVMNTLVENASGRFTSEQIEELGVFVDDDVLRRAAKRSGVLMWDEDEPEPEEEETVEAESEEDTEMSEALETLEKISDSLERINNNHKSGLLGTLFGGILGALFDSSSGSGGKSDSPHYGYRYGRWYYGHGHTYGCDHCDDKESGGKD